MIGNFSPERTLAHFLITKAISTKFLEERRKQLSLAVDCCPPHLLTWPLQDFYTPMTIRNLLRERCINCSDDEMEAVLEAISPAKFLEVSLLELTTFMGLSAEQCQKIRRSNSVKKPTTSSNFTNIFQLQLSKLFEQVISSHRNLQKLRQQLRRWGEPIEIYRLIDHKCLGSIQPSQVVSFLHRHGQTDTEILISLFKLIQEKGVLNYQLVNWWLQPVHVRRLSVGQFDTLRRMKEIETKDEAQQSYTYIDELSSGSLLRQSSKINSPTVSRHKRSSLEKPSLVNEAGKNKSIFFQQNQQSKIEGSQQNEGVKSKLQYVPQSLITKYSPTQNSPSDRPIIRCDSTLSKPSLSQRWHLGSSSQQHTICYRPTAPKPHHSRQNHSMTMESDSKLINTHYLIKPRSPYFHQRHLIR